jgi:hypothetical protein
VIDDREFYVKSLLEIPAGERSRVHVGVWRSVSAVGFECRLHVREYPSRPGVELEPTDHPLAVDQRQGMDRDRAAALAG